jgi:predicted glycoside hydrolase/deacetylase ChbG (UPF0249 family)
MTARHVIVNADDFGASAGINRGIVEAHARGIVTSTSLMVTGRAAREAGRMSRDYPKLGVGLHWDVTGEGERELDFRNATGIRLELRRQLDAFLQLMDCRPTHFDSHHHVHRQERVMEIVRDVVGPDLPVRGDGRATLVGGFYAQWEWCITDLYHVSPEFLITLMRDETQSGWTELSCHPGYALGDYQSVYLSEREAELRTLTDPRVRQAVDRLGIRLANYADLIAAMPEGRAA